MSDPVTVNPQIADAINISQAAVLGQQVVRTGGSGKAYQAVAQSAALAVQDATDRLRNISAIATTASALALSEFLATGDPRYLEGVDRAQAMITTAIADFEAVGAAAASVLTGFPTG